MSKPNIDIEIAIVRAGLKKYQIAERLNINDSSFSRKLRKEFPLQDKKRIIKIIEDLKRENGEV